MKSYLLFLTLGLIDVKYSYSDDYDIGLFYTINENLHRVVDDIFVSLAIAKNFTQTKHIKILQTMHTHLKGIMENNFLVFKEIICSSKADINKHPEEANLTEAVNKLFQEYSFSIPNGNSTESDLNNNTSEDKTCKTCAAEYINKLRKIPGSNVVRVSNKTYFLFTTIAPSSLRKRTLLNLKVWRYNSLSDIGRDSNRTRRIFNGISVSVDEYPFIASIHFFNQFLCAASIISKDVLLTTASCLLGVLNSEEYKFNKNAITVRVGSDYTYRSGRVRTATAFYIHPKFNEDNLDNNLAVVVIKTQLIFTKKNKNIRRIEYDRKNILNSSRSVKMLGWGDRTSFVRMEAAPLSEAQLDIFNLDDCKNIYTPTFVNDNIFCAGFVENGTGACKRDVGGPAIVGSTLVGVVTFGPPECGTPGGPTAFMRLYKYYSWIDYIMYKASSTNVDNIEKDYTLRYLEREASLPNVHLKGKVLVYDTDEPSSTNNENIWTTTRLDMSTHQYISKYFTTGVHSIENDIEQPVQILSQVKSKIDDKLANNRLAPKSIRQEKGDISIIEIPSNAVNEIEGAKEHATKKWTKYLTPLNYMVFPFRPKIKNKSNREIRTTKTADKYSTVQYYRADTHDIDINSDYSDSVSGFKPNILASLGSSTLKKLIKEKYKNFRVPIKSMKTEMSESSAEYKKCILACSEKGSLLKSMRNSDNFPVYTRNTNHNIDSTSRPANQAQTARINRMRGNQEEKMDYNTKDSVIFNENLEYLNYY